MRSGRVLLAGLLLLAQSCAAEEAAAPVPPPETAAESLEGIPVLALPKRQKLPIVVEWSLSVGEPGSMVPDDQDLNERLPRKIHIRRVLDDGTAARIRWQVRPYGEYPAMPSLFAAGDYPAGIAVLPKGVREGVIEIILVPTGKPDWRREFEVVLTDADNGSPVLGPAMTPVVVAFGVAGDRFCAPGRPDLCDTEDLNMLNVEPSRVDR